MRCKICCEVLSFGLCLRCSLPTAEQQKQIDEEKKKAIAEFQAVMNEPPKPKRWGHLRRVK